MEPERDWYTARHEDSDWDIREAGMGLLRFALLFGIGVVGIALFAAPALYKRSENWIANGRAVDPISVGSIRPRADVYTVQKSVLQPSPNSVCVIRPNGTRSGDC